MLIGIISYLAFSISSTIDKSFMNGNRSAAQVNTFKMFFDGIIILIVGSFFFEFNFTIDLLKWSFLLGAIYGFSGIIYFKVLETKNVEVIVPYTHSLMLLIVFVASAFLFGESVSVINYAGMLIILPGMYLVIAEKNLSFPKIDKSLFYLFLISISVSVYFLLVKYLLFRFEAIDLSIMMYLSSAVVLSIYQIIKGEGIRIKEARIVFSAIFAAAGTLLLFISLSQGLATRVFALSGLQSVFVFVLALVFLKERFASHRLIGTILVFIGIFLVSF